MVMACAGILLALVTLPVTIPVETVEGNNIASVEAGGTALRVHIDTGGFKTVGVTTDALSRMSVQFLPETIERPDGSGTRFRGRTFVIPELKLGGQVFRKVRGYERKQAASGVFGGPPPFDAIIGREFLAPYTVVVDYPQRRIELHARDAGERVCGKGTVPFRTSAEGFWLSKVETDHGTFEMIWDTGSRGASFIQERRVAERGLPIKDEAYLTQRFQIGARDFGPIELVPIPLTGFPGIDGTFGISIFADHRVCFDGERSVVSIQ
jgi:hypothetical protein